METDARYAPPTEADVTRLVVEHPFAWLVTAEGGDFAATPLPLRPAIAADGSVSALLGHFSRRNPHVELLLRVPRTLVLFMGPHGYVSSSWFRDRTRTPTWNYAYVQYLVDVKFTDDPAATDACVRDLVGAMESHRPRPWSMEESGERYRGLVRGIIAFRADIVARRVKFKLGQDERDSEYADIAAALSASGQGELLQWMQRCNPRRPGDAC